MPLIGGKELDFFILYNSVCKRGGAEMVSNNKMWKEVVHQLKLPQTCTSASFHLKNHYQKYLLGYEMKFMHKKDDSQVPQLKFGRNIGEQQTASKVQEPSVPTRRGAQQQQQQQKQQESQSESEEDSSEQQHTVLPPNRVDANSSQLGHSLMKYYQKFNKKEPIHYTKKIKMYPKKSDIKRITIAFESRLQDEVVYALNSLLLYSVNVYDPLTLDNAPQLLENLTKYIEDNLKNLPSLSNLHLLKLENSKKEQEIFMSQKEKEVENNSNIFGKGLNVLENYNYPVSQIILHNYKNKIEVSPLQMLQKRKRENIGATYDEVGEVQLLEQIRTIFQILRNICFQKVNETIMAKNKYFCNLIIQLFQYNCDSELTKTILDLLAGTSKYIQLSKLQDHQAFCSRLFEFLYSDKNEELEASVETMRNLIAIQENENLLENMLSQYIDSIPRLLLYSQGEIRENVLEFLCYLSDLKMSTRIALAKQPKLLMRLIGLLGSGLGQQFEKITKMSALTLKNITKAPVSRQYILPFEKELFLVAASDESVQQYLGDILSELDTLGLQEILN
ncbi:Armadillo-type fold [Pseudocohnilembus persalinus]|uniref:Armadillo-type fold n=1 Tax=Pseudocohnilembus persalinus TaxID=266149 RepID=A0A0V0R1E8_PSEPJ|nr:Armadillo-type fold [Pseudocohnilembus persalinus]|eukprot:KRX08359.1 Armadillo-type fold [Pseudocohnilembus persalinus]